MEKIWRKWDGHKRHSFVLLWSWETEKKGEMSFIWISSGQHETHLTDEIKDEEMCKTSENIYLDVDGVNEGAVTLEDERQVAGDERELENSLSLRAET